ncbi:MAG: response regulator [Halioglobus sp.]
MKTHPSAVDWEQAQSLFSIVLCIDQEFRIVDASDTLKRHIDGLDLQPLLTEAFDISRPSNVTNYESAHGYLDSIFLMLSKDRRFAVRGQVVETTIDSKAALCFFGAPWLFWINSNCPDVRLGLGDFSPQDVQLDQLFFMSTEKKMVKDLEQLNGELTQARTELERNQAAKNAFFTQMSHEMRTPLNGVVSALTLLQDQMLSTDANKLVTFARSSAKNLMQVTNYVLDLSKIDATEGVAESEPFELEELVTSVHNIVAAKADEKHIDFVTVCQAGMSAYFLGDLPRLRQSLLNLLINAIKFTDEGSIHLKVSQINHPDSNQEMVRFAVIDTGIGIPIDLQELVFEPFWSSDACSDGRDRGTGLGLDIVRRNVQLMGGHIELKSSVSKGSTFTIDLPLPRHVPDFSANLGHRKPPIENAKFAAHVLLVDDNETNLMLGAMILESLDITVSKANSGLAAVKLARELGPDLVLMDISMPDIDGFEATRRIREFASAQQMPIVALTAFESEAERLLSREVGMNEYLTKPIDRQKLAEQLVNWLPTKAMIDDNTQGANENHDGLVELSILEELQSQIGKKNLETVIGKFLDEAAQRWELLNDAIAAEQTKDCARHAHTLASTCKSFGLTQAGTQLAAIEQSILSDGLSNMEPIEEARVMLQNSVARLRSSVESLT